MQTKQTAKTRFDMTNQKRTEHKKGSQKLKITNQFGEKCPLSLLQYKKIYLDHTQVKSCNLLSLKTC